MRAVESSVVVRPGLIIKVTANGGASGSGQTAEGPGVCGQNVPRSVVLEGQTIGEPSTGLTSCPLLLFFTVSVCDFLKGKMLPRSQCQAHTRPRPTTA